MSRWQQTFEQFKHMFPDLAKGASSVHQADKNGYELSINTTAHVTLRFYFKDIKHWKLETEGTRDRNNP